MLILNFKLKVISTLEQTMPVVLKSAQFIMLQTFKI